MKELLIPFGISNKTQSIVEPDDAERGRACDCYCPGCETPLLSRHPKDDRRIHFAHDSRHPDAVPSVIEKCPFNSLLAIALMSRHVADRLAGQRIHLPDHHARADFGDCGHQAFIQVTRERDLLVDDATAEINAHGLTFDLALKFGTYQVLVWLHYKDRPSDLAADISPEKLGSTGILSIDIHSFNQKDFSAGKERFSEAVLRFLLEEGSRSWLYHPNAAAAVELAKSKHNCQWESSVTRARRGVTRQIERNQDHIDVAVRSAMAASRPPAAPKPTQYQCVLCKKRWVHAVLGAPECPNGCGHYYAREMT